MSGGGRWWGGRRIEGGWVVVDRRAAVGDIKIAFRGLGCDWDREACKGSLDCGFGGFA